MTDFEVIQKYHRLSSKLRLLAIRHLVDNNVIQSGWSVANRHEIYTENDDIVIEFTGNDVYRIMFNNNYEVIG